MALRFYAFTFFMRFDYCLYFTSSPTTSSLPRRAPSKSRRLGVTAQFAIVAYFGMRCWSGLMIRAASSFSPTILAFAWRDDAASGEAMRDDLPGAPCRRVESAAAARAHLLLWPRPPPLAAARSGDWRYCCRRAFSARQPVGDGFRCGSHRGHATSLHFKRLRARPSRR